MANFKIYQHEGSIYFVMDKPVALYLYDEQKSSLSYRSSNKPKNRTLLETIQKNEVIGSCVITLEKKNKRGTPNTIEIKPDLKVQNLTDAKLNDLSDVLESLKPKPRSSFVENKPEIAVYYNNETKSFLFMFGGKYYQLSDLKKNNADYVQESSALSGFSNIGQMTIQNIQDISATEKELKIKNLNQLLGDFLGKKISRIEQEEIEPRELAKKDGLVTLIRNSNGTNPLNVKDFIDKQNISDTEKSQLALTFLMIAHEQKRSDVIQAAIEAYESYKGISASDSTFILYKNTILAEQFLNSPAPVLTVEPPKETEEERKQRWYEEQERLERWYEEERKRAIEVDELFESIISEDKKETEGKLLEKAVELLHQPHENDIYKSKEKREDIRRALINFKANHDEQSHTNQNEILQELWQEDRKDIVIIPEHQTYSNTKFQNEISLRLSDLKKLSASPDEYMQMLQYVYSGDEKYLSGLKQNIIDVVKTKRSDLGKPDFYLQISRDEERFNIKDYQDLIQRIVSNEFDFINTEFISTTEKTDLGNKAPLTLESHEFNTYKSSELHDIRDKFNNMLLEALDNSSHIKYVQKHRDTTKEKYSLAKKILEILDKPDDAFDKQILRAQFEIMKLDVRNKKYKDKTWEKDIAGLVGAPSPTIEGRERSSSTSSTSTESVESSRRTSEDNAETKPAEQNLSEFNEDAQSTFAIVNLDRQTNMIVFTIAKRDKENAYFQWDPENPSSPAKQISLDANTANQRYYPCGGINFQPTFLHVENEVRLGMPNDLMEKIQKLERYQQYLAALQSHTASTASEVSDVRAEESAPVISTEQQQRKRSASAPPKRESYVSEEEKQNEHARVLQEALEARGKNHFNQKDYDIFSTIEGRAKINAAIEAFKLNDDLKQDIEKVKAELERYEKEASEVFVSSGSPEPIPSETKSDTPYVELNPIVESIEIGTKIEAYRDAIAEFQSNPQADPNPIDVVINNLSLAQTKKLLEVFPKVERSNTKNLYAELLLRKPTPADGWNAEQQKQIQTFRDLVAKREFQIHEEIIAEAHKQVDKAHDADIYAEPESRAKIQDAIAYMPASDNRIEAINKELWKIDSQKPVNITSQAIPNSLGRTLNQDLSEIKKHSQSPEEYATALKYVLEGKQDRLNELAENTELQQACVNMRIRFTSPAVYLYVSEDNFKDKTLGEIQNEVSNVIVNEILTHDENFIEPNVAFNDARKSLAAFQSFEIAKLAGQFEKYADILIRAHNSAPRYGNLSAEEMAQIQKFVNSILELSDYDYQKQMFNATFAKVASRTNSSLTTDKIPDLVNDIGTKNLNVLFYLERYAAATTKKDQKAALTEITPHLKEIMPLLEESAIYQARVIGKKDNNNFTDNETQKVKDIFATFKSALEKLKKQDEHAAAKNKKQAAPIAPAADQPAAAQPAPAVAPQPIAATPIAIPVDQTLTAELDNYKNAATPEAKKVVVDSWSAQQVDQLLEKFHIDASEEVAKLYKEHLEANQRSAFGQDSLSTQLRTHLLARKRELTPVEIMPVDNTPMFEGNYRSAYKDPLGGTFTDIVPKQAKIGAADYVEIVSPSLAATELKNRRPTQEDRVIMCELPAELYLLSDADIEKYIKQNIMPKLHAGCDEVSRQNPINDHGSWRDGGGSCLLMNFVIPVPNSNQNRIVTISLGDSTAFVHQGEKLEQLNPELHNTHDPKERERIKQITGKELGLRFANILSVTGAMGDVTVTHEQGWQREPYVLFKTVEGDFTLLVACDGLTEADQLQLEQIQEYLNLPENRNKSAEELCELAQKAITAGSGDNISLIIVKNQPGMYGVFDGHGSSLVSEWLRVNTPRIVTHELSLAIAAKKQKIAIAGVAVETVPAPETKTSSEISAGAEKLAAEQDHIRQLAAQRAALDQDVVKFLEEYRNNPEILRSSELSLLAKVEKKLNGDPDPKAGKPYKNIYLGQRLNEEPNNPAKISILQKILRTEPEKREKLGIARKHHPKTEMHQPLLNATYHEVIVEDGQIKQIHAPNQDDKLRAEIGLMDYTAVVDDNFAVTELLGHRSTQEDRCAAIDIPSEWSKLSDEEIIYLIQNKVMPELHKIAEKSADDAFKKEGNKPGACLLMNFVIPGKDSEPARVVTVSLGDSTALLHINGELKQLNPQLHNAGEEDEKIRVLNAGGVIKKDKGVDRLYGVMASGSMGDNDFNQREADGTLSLKGYQRIPHICIDTVPANSDCTFFFACDGLTEGSEFEIPKLEELLDKPENQGKSAAELSLLAQQAIDHGNAGNELFTILQHAKGKPYEEIQQLILEAKNQNKIDEELYAEISQAIAENKSHDECLEIARKAIHKGSNDNITNMVVKGARAGVYFVFDGHGGSEVSEALRVSAPDVVFRHFQNAAEAKVQNNLAITAEISQDKNLQSDAQLIADAYADKPLAYDMKKREQLNNALSKLFSHNSSADVTVNQALYNAVIAKLPTDNRNINAEDIKDHIENSWAYQRTVQIPSIADIPEKYRNGPHDDIKRLKLLCDSKDIYLNALQYIETGDPLHFLITNQSQNGEAIRDLVIAMRSNFTSTSEEINSETIAKRRAAYEIVIKAIRHYDSTYKPEVNNFKELLNPFGVATPIADDSRSKLLPLIQKDLTELITLSKSSDEYSIALQYILDGDLFKIHFPENQELQQRALAIREKYSTPNFYLNLTPEIFGNDNIGTLRKEAHSIFRAAIPSASLQAKLPSIETFNDANEAQNTSFWNAKIPDLNRHTANIISAYKASIASPPTDASCFQNRTIKQSLQLLQQSDEFYKVINAKLASESIVAPTQKELIRTINNNWHYEEKYKTPDNLDVKTKTEERFSKEIAILKTNCKTRSDFSAAMQFIADGNGDAFHRDFKGTNKDPVKLAADQLRKDFTALETYLDTDAVTAKKADQIIDVARVFTHLPAAGMQNRMDAIMQAHSPKTQINRQQAEIWNQRPRDIIRNLNDDIAALKELYANKKDLNKISSANQSVILALYEKMKNPYQNSEYLNELIKKVDQGEVTVARRFRKDLVITWNDIMRAGPQTVLEMEEISDPESITNDSETDSFVDEDENTSNVYEDDDDDIVLREEEEVILPKIALFKLSPDNPYLNYFYPALNDALANYGDAQGQIADQEGFNAAIKYLLTGEGDIEDENVKLVRNDFISEDYYLREREKLIVSGILLTDNRTLSDLTAAYDRELRNIAEHYNIDISNLPENKYFNLAKDNALFQKPLMRLPFKNFADVKNDTDILIQGFNNTNKDPKLAAGIHNLLGKINNPDNQYTKNCIQAWFDYQKSLGEIDKNLTLDIVLQNISQKYAVAANTPANANAASAQSTAASTEVNTNFTSTSTAPNLSTSRAASTTIEAQPIQGKIWFEHVVSTLSSTKSADKTTDKYTLNHHEPNKSATFSSQNGPFSIMNDTENNSIKFDIQGNNQGEVYSDIMSSLGNDKNIELTLRSSNASNLNAMIANVPKGMIFKVDFSKLKTEEAINSVKTAEAARRREDESTSQSTLNDVTNFKRSPNSYSVKQNRSPSAGNENIDPNAGITLKPGGRPLKKS